MINRKQYIDKLLDYKDKKVIKILTGIRRCGKSSVLALLAEKLTGLGINPENIVQINFESMRFSDVQDYKAFYNYVKDKISSKGKTYLLFDEVQLIDKWEKAVNSFIVDFDVDVYITGSNAYLLSSELSTLLSGRYVEIKMLPLSFKEFLDFNSFEREQTLDDKFQLFAKFGGMPTISEFNFKELMIREILADVFNTVILKDVVSRTSITNPKLLRRLIEFLSDNVGSINSINKISNYLVSDKSLSAHQQNKTIENYILALENAFVFYPVRRYDIKGKSLLKTLNKHYIADVGLRNMLLGFKDTNRGRTLENIVFLELIRRGYSVSIGKINNLEIDFIAEKPQEKIYYQVTESLLDKSVADREFASLNLVNDNYEKIVLSMDKNFISSKDGVKMKNIIDFLLEK